MIDSALLRNDPDRIRASQIARGDDPEIVDAAIDADAIRRRSLATYEALRAEQNAHSKLVAQAPKEEKAALVAAAQELAASVKAAQLAAGDAESAFESIVSGIGNVVIDGVPAGGEDDWALIREVGVPREFDFAPRDHVEIG